MDRKPLIAALVWVMGCADPYQYPGAFDGPISSAVLEQGAGLFDEPVGFVANSRNGTIVPIDLKHATLLGDQYGAPFLRPRWIATGMQRILGPMVAWAPTEETVSVYAADLAHDVLIEAPYIIGMDPEPQITTPSHTDPVFEDRDESGDSAKLDGIILRNSWTTTEDWEVEFDGEIWRVTGSRSGLQSAEAQTGKHYRTEEREVEFDISGTATRGDRFTFSTDTGIIEHDLGGTILALKRIPDVDMLIAGVWDPILEESSIVVWDPAVSLEVGRFTLPANPDSGAEDGETTATETSQAWRFAFGDTPADLFIADAHRPVVYQTLLNLDAPEDSVWEEIPTIAPVVGVAYVSDTPDSTLPSNQDEDTGDLFEDVAFNRDYAHLFVAPAGENRVDVFDLDSRTWIDVNPLDEVDGGIDLFSPVVGLDASVERITLRERTDFGARLQKSIVAVTTLNGSLVLLEGDTGCAAQTGEGPHVAISRGFESVSFVDVGQASSPTMLLDEATNRRVMTNQCGGVVRTERWTVTYDEVDGSWEVEGNRSGPQEALAIEDQRFVSDDGSISFTIVAGSLPSSAGDSFTFTTTEGILRVDSMSRNASQSTTPLELPAEPTVFQYLAGPTGGGWDPVDRRTFVLVPVTNTDVVLRVRIKSWRTEVIWD